jgi:signal transduction histidine kinase
MTQDWIDALAGPFGAHVVALTDRFHVEYANASACELLGASDLGELSAKWHVLAPQLSEPDLGDRFKRVNPYRFSVDLPKTTPARSLRMETYLRGSKQGYLVFLRQALDYYDANLLLAAQMRNQRYLVAALAHDLNGPLNAINLTVALLSRHATLSPVADLSETVERLAVVLRTEVEKLQHTIQRFPQYLDGVPGSIEALDLREAITEAAQWLNYALRIRRINFALDLPSAPVQINANRHRLRQALLILGIHALEKSQSGHTLTASLRREGENAQLVLAHEGPQLAEDLLNEVFQLYIPRNGGADLYAARLIVETHCGEFSIEKGEASGMRFLVHLPLASAKAPL